MRKEIRDRLIKEHGGKCAICGAKMNLEIDHIIPVSKGGRENESNMQVLCRSCNSRKGNRIDYTQFFKFDESPEYMLMDRSICILRLTAKEWSNLTEAMFDLHKQYWGS